MDQNRVLRAARPFFNSEFGEPQGASLHSRVVCRADELVAEHSDTRAQLRHHLESRILPLIAVYQELQTVMTKEDALQLAGAIFLSTGPEMADQIKRILKIPLLYRIVPAMFRMGIRMRFNEAAGFGMNEYPRRRGVFRLDMTKCPYYDTCERHGCPELTQWFCRIDDIIYGDMHPRLDWGRTKTIGLGQDCCDFKLTVRKK